MASKGARVRGFGPDEGQDSTIWPRRGLGFEDLALIRTRVSTIWTRKRLGFEDLAPKVARNRARKLVWSSLGSFSGLGSEMAPGSLFLRVFVFSKREGRSCWFDKEQGSHFLTCVCHFLEFGNRFWLKL